METAEKKKRRGINWHRITFWGSLGTAIVLIGFAQIRKDHRIITVFSEEGRYELAKYLRYYHPAIAVKLGVAGK